MKKRLFALGLALLMVAACLAACGDNSSSQADQPASTGSSPESTGAAIKIGGTGPLTGGAAIYGNAAKNGAQIAVDEINALGGLQFELRYEDDVHDPEKAVTAYNTLKDWGMQAFLGSVTSKPAVATSTEANNDHLLHRRAGRRGEPPDRNSGNPPQGQHLPDVLCGSQPGFRLCPVYL